MRKIIDSKKAQGTIDMSFNWIFALILIMVFIFAAIYAIIWFINMGSCSKVGLFYDDFQQKVDEAYQSSSSDFEMEVNIPGIKQLCFSNLSEKITGSMTAYEELNLYEFYDANTFLLPSTKACDMPYKTIKHINLSKTTSLKNPLCIDVGGGATVRIIKGYYDKGVTIK
jgi:hypothetical protein